MAASSHLGAGICKPPWDSISVPEIRQLADQLCKSFCLHSRWLNALDVEQVGGNSDPAHLLLVGEIASNRDAIV